MNTNPRIVFVGQGPNQACWKRGFDLGVRSISMDPLLLVKYPEGAERMAAVNAYAENYSRRLAITGTMGRKLATLAGYDVKQREELRFYAEHGRRNLNARWNGKSGKGDVFDREEAVRAALAIQAEGFDRHVLLGHEVAWAFDFARVPFLEEKLRHNNAFNKPQTFLIFPHPSGLSTWWNEPFNVHRATKRLRAYLQ